MDCVPQGHKVALSDIPEGAPIRRYNEVIGTAAQRILAGEWVDEVRIQTPTPPDPQVPDGEVKGRLGEIKVGRRQCQEHLILNLDMAQSFRRLEVRAIKRYVRQNSILSNIGKLPWQRHQQANPQRAGASRGQARPKVARDR